MFKKLIILVFVAGAVAVASIPMWTSFIADNAFKKHELSDSPEMIDKAIRLKMYFYLYADARKIAEKAIIYFPESKFAPGYIYSAGMCAEKEKNVDAAIYWYEYFIQRYPNHSWASATKNNLNKLKGIYK
ncbi:MAG TPA: hypothetical protein PK821_05230 [Victivallales bacterium]|nr:hypothetical protein [Victivallales bacterium]